MEMAPSSEVPTRSRSAHTILNHEVLDWLGGLAWRTSLLVWHIRDQEHCGQEHCGCQNFQVSGQHDLLWITARQRQSTSSFLDFQVSDEIRPPDNHQTLCARGITSQRHQFSLPSSLFLYLGQCPGIKNWYQWSSPLKQHSIIVVCTGLTF